MAEQEIAKHGKKIIKILMMKEGKFLHNVNEIFMEVFTIAFAIVLSIWFHDLSEHHQRQNEVKKFLLGLRKDLSDDTKNLKAMVAAYHKFDEGYIYLSKLTSEEQPGWKDFSDAYDAIDINWYFIPDKNRFDGFMMSGKLSTVENEEILTSVLNLYQSILPQIKASEHGWLMHQESLRTYRESKIIDGSQKEQYRIITSPKGRLLITNMITRPQLYNRCQEYISSSQKIIELIDKEYPSEK